MAIKKQIQPITSPIPIGINILKFMLAIPSKYVEYTPRHISINVLLTPGKTTPMDIRNPDNIRNR